MDRAEKQALGVAGAAHVLMFALLSTSFRSGPEQRFDNPPMAVDIVAEIAPVSSAPDATSEPPAPRLGEEAPEPESAPPEPEPEPQPPAPPEPRPAPPPPQPKKKVERAPAPRPTPPPTPKKATPRPTPAPARSPTPAPRATPAPAPRPAPKAAAKATPTPAPRPSGRSLGDIAASVSGPASGRATGTAAAQTASEIRRAISTSINAEVARPWNACHVTGVDIDRLKTTVVFRLTQSGGLDRITSVETSGVNDSNRPQVERFEECARRAIQLAAPFTLPRENYSYWQTYTLDFEKR